jgi:hypothetical protein
VPYYQLDDIRGDLLLKNHNNALNRACSSNWTTLRLEADIEYDRYVETKCEIDGSECVGIYSRKGNYRGRKELLLHRV